jgi:hypothetical protein
MKISHCPGLAVGKMVREHDLIISGTGEVGVETKKVVQMGRPTPPMTYDKDRRSGNVRGFYLISVTAVFKTGHDRIITGYNE